MIYWRFKCLKGPNAYYYFFPVFQRKKKLNGSEMDKIWKQKEILAKRAEVKIEERKEKHY